MQTWVPGAVFVLALVRIASGHPFVDWSAPEPHQGHASAPEAATTGAPAVSAQAQRVLGGLAVGDEVAGLEVERIGGPDDGQIVVELRDGARGARVWITRRGARNHAPSRQALRFDLFHGLPRPGLERVSDETFRSVLESLGRRIEAAGADPEQVGL
jgi:hypothetical protein